MNCTERWYFTWFLEYFFSKEMYSMIFWNRWLTLCFKVNESKFVSGVAAGAAAGRHTCGRARATQSSNCDCCKLRGNYKAHTSTNLPSSKKITLFYVAFEFMIHFIVKNILLSLKLVETFAYNSIYFLKRKEIFLVAKFW